MTTIRTILFLAVCIAAASSMPTKQTSTAPPTTPAPKPCTSPPKWEGRASEYDHKQGINNRFLISFDGESKMKRFIEERKSFMPGKRFFEYIQDYTKNIQYKINKSYNQCTVDKLNTPWQNHTIPVNATLEDQYTMGDVSEQFHVQEWSDRIPGHKKEAWIGAFTVKNCWPVFEVFTYNDPEDEYSVSTSTRFFDLTVGIKDMSVFTPPDICNKALKEFEERDESFVNNVVEFFKKMFTSWSI
ncbi:mammalian ependymin-related protein 1-like [Antedon mediterranea]|uniref:mammalian ependymin-related protein 1-like n=1 Tax=Antedon mediterranea TaxID=105859 RepID=UPI003AF6E46C